MAAKPRPALAAAKKALQALETELTEKVARRIEPTRQDDTAVGADEDEQPLSEMNQAIASNRNRHDALQLARVRAALKRLAQAPEDFGLCTDCGDDLPAGRLKAMPWAELCVQCQAERDGRGLATRSKLTDYR